MKPKPVLINFHLPQCCWDELQRISDINDFGQLLRISLKNGPFFTMFGSGSIDLAFTILTTDWDELNTAIDAVSPLIRERIRTNANKHSLEHFFSGEHQLHAFWQAMADSF
jgi:hypothetical protein